jgi:glycosyltransferase involved in cell wall biosynthesis
VASIYYRDAPASRSPDRLLHIVYLGDARSEKGYARLPQLVLDAAAAQLSVRFTIQSNFSVPGGEGRTAKARARLSSLPLDYCVNLITEPLAGDAYRRLLLEADVVVLPYDAEAYASRSSGVFVEALAAGRPVIVPAGTWMAAELARVGPRAGAVFANSHNLTTCLADIVRNYDSFAHEARAVSRVWSEYHSTDRLVDLLIAN